jgi:heme exporter protein D
MSSGDGGTISWYAYQDPKSGREYFHEPVSGETSWVLPTSRNYRSSMQAGSSGDKSARQSEQMGSSHHKPHVWSAVGMTIVFLLVFNTLFLLVLVKVLRESNDLQNNTFNIKIPDDPRLGAVVDAFPNPASEVPLPTIEQIDIDNEAQYSSPDMEKEVEDEEIHQYEPFQIIKDIKHADAGESHAKHGAKIEGKSKHQNIEREGNVERESEKSVDERDNTTPIRCWVPFSYILLRKCRQQARDGLPMPLGNVENFLLI